MKLHDQAKELVSKHQKKRAVLVLKLRRCKEIECDKVESQLLSVVKMIDDIEWQSHHVDILKALQAGTSALNKLHEEFAIDDVAELLDATNEAIEVVRSLLLFFLSVNKYILRSKIKSLHFWLDNHLLLMMKTCW